MKLWRLSDPHDYAYARASRRGSWAGSPERRVRPLVIEWEPDSDVIGDFTWPGFDSDVIVKGRVANALQAAAVPGFELGAVRMQENSERAKRRSKAPRVQLPYAGPRLWELWVTAWAPADRDRSTIKEVREGESTRLVVVGAQHVETVWDQQRMALARVMHPRKATHGLFVRAIRGFFRVAEPPPGSSARTM